MSKDIETRETRETWYEYDNHNNVISMKSSDGWELTYVLSYDKKGNLIKQECSDGVIEIYNYDENNRRIYWESKDLEKKNKYDFYDWKEWTEYDNNGNITYEKFDSLPGISETWYKYDSKGRKIYEKEID